MPGGKLVGSVIRCLGAYLVSIVSFIVLFGMTRVIYARYGLQEKLIRYDKLFGGKDDPLVRGLRGERIYLPDVDETSIINILMLTVFNLVVILLSTYLATRWLPERLKYINIYVIAIVLAIATIFFSYYAYYYVLHTIETIPAVVATVVLLRRR